MNFIDKIASAYNYTHDEVFELEAGFAYQLSLMNYEKMAYKERAENVRQNLKQKP